MKRSHVIISLILLTSLACGIDFGTSSTNEPDTSSPIVQNPTMAPAPLPTEPPVPTVLAITPTPSPVSYANPIKPGETVNGDTTSRGETWYFYGTQGDIITIVMTGDPPYFAIRDQDEKGLQDCERVAKNICSLIKFSLPYTGLYYLYADKGEKSSFWTAYGYGPQGPVGSPYSMIFNPTK